MKFLSTTKYCRYKTYKDQYANARQYVVPSSPARYDTVYVEPNLKEYETQVLQMVVPVDDQEDYNDLQIDFSNKNHAFSLENVSYIGKDTNLKNYGIHFLPRSQTKIIINDFTRFSDKSSPVSSESATTARASSVGDNHLIKNTNNNIRRDHIYR